MCLTLAGITGAILCCWMHEKKKKKPTVPPQPCMKQSSHLDSEASSMPGNLNSASTYHSNEQNQSGIPNVADRPSPTSPSESHGSYNPLLYSKEEQLQQEWEKLSQQSDNAIPSPLFSAGNASSQNRPVYNLYTDSRPPKAKPMPYSPDSIGQVLGGSAMMHQPISPAYNGGVLGSSAMMHRPLTAHNERVLGSSAAMHSPLAP